MSLMRLSVQAVRNLQPLSIQPSPRINLIAGNNGSGKTSVLEAIHLLGLARSFRSARLTPVIQDGADSFLLLEGLPQDWGLFHVEPGFWPVWQRLQRALDQRNAWLRHGRIEPAMQAVWDQEFCTASEPLDNYRRAYVQQLIPVFTDVLARLLTLPDLSLSYYRGWDKERHLADDLPSELDGPHRRALCRLLEELNCQVFITGVDWQTLKDGWHPETPVALFQIEQGCIESSGVKA